MRRLIAIFQSHSVCRENSTRPLPRRGPRSGSTRHHRQRVSSWIGCSPCAGNDGDVRDLRQLEAPIDVISCPMTIDMHRLIVVAVLGLVVLAPAPNASAQLLAAKDGPIVYGHHHLNVTNMDEAKKFWVDTLGGVLIKVGPENREIIKFPNALMLL